MNATFGTNRTAAACQVAHSQLSTGVIPRPAAPETADADADIRNMLLDVLRGVAKDPERRKVFEEVVLESLFSKAS
jgi:hypothetical protein